MESSKPFDRLRAALDQVGLPQAVLSHPETLASLGCFQTPVEDWPVSNPFVPVPALLCLGPDAAVLVVADFHVAHASACVARLVTYRSYDFRSPPDPAAALRAALLRALDDAGIDAGPVGVEAADLPYGIAEWLREAGRMPVACDTAVASSLRVTELDAIRRACRLADVVQQAVKDHAAPGLSEAELAGLAAAAMFRAAGRRVPAILTVTAGAEATATGGGIATARIVQADDLVLTDTSPWLDGVWSDTASAVYVGTPDRETRRRFDAVRRALAEGISLCRPGAVAKDVDRDVRALLAVHGPTYAHHTGHGIGASWSEEPRITPYSDRRIEEGMVLALEPAIYLPGWGGIRLEHVFVVGAGDNEILTRFEHTL
ncbi:MAG: M24 family metallopeptidase [Gaiellaceae bacterium]